MGRFVPCVLALLVVSACRAPSRVSEKSLKIATYNIYFLDGGISEARRQHLRQVLAELDADVIAFQEINDPAALRNILPDGYAVAMIDDPNEVQELALAVRAPLRIRGYRYAFPDSSYDDAFPRSRDLLQVEAEGLGRTWVFLVHHAKSRRGGRWRNDARRERATALMVDYIRRNLRGRSVVILGDFNDNPDDRSVNILEYGDRNAPAGIDTMPDAFLFNATEALLAQEYASYGYHALYGEVEQDTFPPAVPGSRAENNRWRGREHDYYRDVQIKAILFDQILVSSDLRDAVAAAGVFHRSVAVRGEPSRIRFDDGRLVYTRRGSLASDHVPVWVALRWR